MLRKPLLFILFTHFWFVLTAQEFRGIITTKVYAEKGEIENQIPDIQELEDGTFSMTSKVIGIVDTVFNTYSICGDTVVQLQNYDSGIDKAYSAQLGDKFYLAGGDFRLPGYFFRHKAPPSGLEVANKGDWSKPKKEYRRLGYNNQWVSQFNPRYAFISDIDTSLSYGWAGHQQGMLNHLFPTKGVHRKMIENHGDDVWIHDYKYQVIDTLSCDRMVDLFEFKEEEETGVDEFMRSRMMTKGIIPLDEREALIPFDAVDQYETPVLQKGLSGQLTYIDFWASWCEPCIKEMPDLKKLREHYDEKEVRIISISIDTKQQVLAWRKAMDKYKIDWDSWRIDERTTKMFFDEYNMGGVPRYMLLDHEGNVMNANAPRPSNPSIIEWLDEQIIEY